MRLHPTPIDTWCAFHLGRLIGDHPFSYLVTQSFINHNVFGGFWFALSFFLLWVWPSDESETVERGKRQRLLFTILGSLVAIALALWLEELVRWLPPNRMPGLAQLYPDYLGANPNDNSFPSLSVALYAPIAAGITSLRRKLGSLLWIAVALCVALPRMYVGGHYLTDIIAGLAAGLVGFYVGRIAESRLPRLLQPAPKHTQLVRLLTNVVVFSWLVQVAVEFRDAVWLVRGLKLVMARLT
jgi:membrane-associated phospholipid phosphatase